MNEEYKWQMSLGDRGFNLMEPNDEPPPNWQIAPGVLGVWRLRHVSTEQAWRDDAQQYNNWNPPAFQYIWERLLVKDYGKEDIQQLAGVKTAAEILVAQLEVLLTGGGR